MTPKNNEISKSEQINQLDDRGRHFSSISVDNFRCFKNFSMDSFERINLIGGKNNVGKTTLLEILFMLLGATNVSVILKVDNYRGVDKFEGDASSIPETLWKHYFYNFDEQANITIDCTLGNGKKIGLSLKQITGVTTTLPIDDEKSIVSSKDVPSQSLKVEYTDVSGETYPLELRVSAQGIIIPPPMVEPLFQGIIHPSRRRPSSQENTARFSQLEIVENHYDIVSALNIIEPRLKRISTIITASGPMLYADIGLGRMLPLVMLGDGLLSLASILLSISSASGGIVLIDEIENGFHYSILEKVWQAISNSARFHNTQVFATTHSFECIVAAHKAFMESDFYDFRYQRLQSEDGDIKAVMFDKNSLQTTIDAGWEIR